MTAERKDEAVVLASRPWRETSLIVTFLGREGGRFACVAKGAKRQKGGLGGAAEPLSVVEVVYRAKEGRGLQTLVSASLVASNQALREDPLRFACAQWMCELVARLVPAGEPLEEVYGLLRGGLEGLATTREPVVLVRWFQVRLLDSLGYWAPPDRCSDCGRPLEGSATLSTAGGVYCDVCRPPAGAGYTLGKGALALLAYLGRADAKQAARTGAAASIVAELEALDRLVEALAGSPSKAAAVALSLLRGRG